MYEWVQEVDKLVQSLKGEVNDIATRAEVANNIIDVLNKHKVQAFVDCSVNVNTTEVVHYGEFRAKIETSTMTIIFKYVRKDAKKSSKKSSKKEAK